MYLLPKPKQMEIRTGTFALGYQSRIVIDPQILENGRVYASILKSCAWTSAGLSLKMVAGKPKAGDIFLTLTHVLSPQEYCLEIEENRVTVFGGDGAGVLYGVETLCQVMEQCGAVLECEVTIWTRPEAGC